MAKLIIPSGKKKAVGVALLKKKESVEKATAAVAQARTPQAKAVAIQKARVETQQLAQLVKAVRPPKPVDKKPVVQRMSQMVAQAKLQQTGQDIQQRQTEKKALQLALRSASPVQKTTIKAQIKQADESLRRLQTRRERQAKGIAIPRPQRLQAPSRRVLLIVPKTALLPEKSVIKKIAQKLGKRVPRRPGESKLQYQQRLVILSQRAAVRYMQAKPVTTLVVPMTPAQKAAQGYISPAQAQQPQFQDESLAIEHAVEQTAAQDAEVVADEIQSGGAVADPAVEAAEEVVEDAIEEIGKAAGASEAVEPEQLAVEAEAGAAELMEAGAEEAKPFYKRPVVLAVAGVAALLLILRR